MLLGRGRRRVLAEGGSGARPGADLLRRRRAQDGLRPSCSSACRRTEFGARVAAEAADAAAGGCRRTCAARRRCSTPTCRRASSSISTISAPRAGRSTPSANDFVAEIVTGRYGPLTYARANSEPEDISFFDRRRHRNIAVYPSDDEARHARPLLQRGRQARLRHHALRDRNVVRAGSAVDRRHREALDPHAGVVFLDADAPAGRLAGRAQHHVAAVRPPAAPAGRRPEQRAGRASRRRSSPTPTSISSITYGGRLLPQGVDREAVTVRAGPRAGGRDRHPARAAVPLQQPQLLVPAVAGDRLRDGEADDHGAGRVRRRRQRHAAGAGDARCRRRPGCAARKKFVFEAAQPTRYLAVPGQPLSVRAADRR